MKESTKQYAFLIVSVAVLFAAAVGAYIEKNQIMAQGRFAMCPLCGK